MLKFVTTMTADIWNEADCDEEVVKNPTFEEVKTKVERLDAKKWTMVILSGGGEAFLTIGGGNGRYVVILTRRSEEFWNLIGLDDPQGGGDVLINIGGQEGDFPKRQVIALRTTLKAAESFFWSGEMDSTLVWEQEA